MNFILRGILTLKEKKGRTLILLGIMMTVCVVILASFGIQAGAQAAAVLAREKLGATVTISQNMEKMMEQQRSQAGATDGTQGERKRVTMEKKDVPLEYVGLLNVNEHVTGYYLSNSTGANLTELLPVGKEEETTTTQSNNPGFMNGNNPGFSNIPKGMHMSGDITISGVNSFNMSEDFLNGVSTLTDGEPLTEVDLQTNVVMVEKTFADENELTVGSTFSIEDTDGNNVTEVEVIGIYTSTKEVSDNGFNNTSQLPYNTVIAPYTLVSTLNGEESTTGVNTMKFYLDDPMNVDAFVEFANETAIDLETYLVDGASREYESMMKPIENIAAFSKTTILIVSLFGGLILALIIILSIKDRINEIGMLMALGEKRIKIIGQFLVEALVVLVVAFSISIAAGNVISSKIGDVLLENELTEAESAAPNEQGFPGGAGGFGGSGTKPTFNSDFGGNRGGVTTEKIDALDVTISSLEISKTADLAFLIVILATILPSVMIMRYNPKRILSKHS